MAELKAMRRTDPKQYWSSKIQAEDLALIEGQVGKAAREARLDVVPKLLPILVAPSTAAGLLLRRHRLAPEGA